MRILLADRMAIDGNGEVPRDANGPCVRGVSIPRRRRASRVGVRICIW